MPLGFKRWTDSKGVLHGRLEIGYMRQGLSFAYYEPVGDLGSDRGPEVGIYFDSRGYKTVNREPIKGSVESWSPGVHDVYWYPWAKPFTGESSTTKGTEIIQRRDLYDMWCYLMATDPDEVAERAKGLDVPGKMRRWAFYQIASDWKRKEMKKRAAKARRTGIDVQDVELSDSEDEGFGADEEEQRERLLANKRKRDEMPPPYRPGNSNKKRKGNAVADSGINRGNNGHGRGRALETPDGLSLSPYLASGGLGDRESVQHHRRPSFDPACERQGSLDPEYCDDRDPRKRSGSQVRGHTDSPFDDTFGLGDQDDVHTSVEDEPSTARRDQNLAQWGRKFGSRQEYESSRSRAASVSGRSLRGHLSPPNVLSSSRRSLDGRSSSPNAAQVARAHWRTSNTGNHRPMTTDWTSLNNGLDDEAAVRAAERASMAPEEQVDIFALDRLNDADQPSDEDMEMLQRDSGLAEPSRVGGPFVTNDDDGAVDATTGTERVQPGARREGSPAEEARREDEVNGELLDGNDGTNSQNGEAGAEDEAEAEEPAGEDEWAVTDG